MKKVICFFIMILITCSNFVFANENLADGLYKVDIDLWHAYEDKPSMGNPGIDGVANIFVKDEKMQIYIGVKKISFANITTSVSRFFYADDESKVYKLASTYVFEIKIEEEEQLRPRVFSFPLENKSEFFDVLIDPKVEQMGNDPIKARLKVDWSKLERITDNDSLYSLATNDKSEIPKYKEFNENGVLVKFADFVFVPVSISKVSSSEIENKIPFDVLDEVYIYKIVKSEEEIPFEKGVAIGVDEIYSGVDIDFLEVKSADKVYRLEDDKYEEVNFIQGDVIKLKDAKTGFYVIVDYADIQKKEINKTQASNIKNSSPVNNNIIQKKSENTNLAVLSDKSLGDNVHIQDKLSLISENVDEKAILTSEDIILQTSEDNKEIFVNNKETSVDSEVIVIERWDIIFLISFIYILFFVFGIILIKKYVKKIFWEIERMMDINRKIYKNQEDEL